MGVPISLVLDCADPLRVGAFWRQALGYEEADPPHGYASWAEVTAAGPADGVGYVITDPDDAGVGPLVELGATVVRRNQDPGDWFVVLQDPEGNELCLV
jgi:Glyoxalase-like domain